MIFMFYSVIINHVTNCVAGGMMIIIPYCSNSNESEKNVCERVSNAIERNTHNITYTIYIFGQPTKDIKKINKT